MNRPPTRLLDRPVLIVTLISLSIALYPGCATTPKLSAKASLSVKEVGAFGKAGGPVGGGSGSGEVSGNLTVELSWVGR